MAGLIPWRKQRTESTGNGGTLTLMRDIPMLMRRLQNEFDELFERFASDLPVAGRESGSSWRWDLDVDDREDGVVIRAEAPGFEAGDFDIQVTDDRLILRAARKSETKNKQGEYREHCECYESMTLPAGIDKDKIDANYHNGVLTLSMPKTAPSKAKRIAVKAN